MAYVDANYFLRLILKDVPSQYEKAYHLIGLGSKGKINLITSTLVFFEVYWVLSSYYEIPKKKIIEALSSILEMNYIELPEREILTQTTASFKDNNLGLEDCYHCCYAKKYAAEELVTFDKKLLKFFKAV